MGSVLADLGVSSSNRADDDGLSTLYQWPDRSEQPSVGEVKMHIVLSEDDLGFLEEIRNEKTHASSRAVGIYTVAHLTIMKYYPYSAISCLLLLAAGLIGLVTFIFGFHDQVFVSFWVLVIGGGMLRTLLIASRERQDADENRPRRK